MNIASNEARCTSCHSGYGWKDNNFDFTNEQKVDCLVCHEQSREYKKFPTDAGYPALEDKYFGDELYKKVDLNKSAQSVGLPTRHNCGACHFYGGGGDGVKHGDLDSSLIDPPYDLDVHMSKDGGDFSCARCHTTVDHKIAGRCYKTPAFTDRKSVLDSDMVKRISCVSCHTDSPHKNVKKLNDHTDKVSCQACHIPAFARQNPTKMQWDWSTAGDLKDGKPYVEMDEEMQRIKYSSQKGDFTWEKNVEPEYFWYNGSLEYVLLTDEIDPSNSPIKLNCVMGDMNDEKSRIYPFKVHKAKQPYDKINNKMAAVHLYGKNNTSYWSNFHWGNAIQTAMDYMDLPYSGEYEFIDTEYHFQITHMVAPAKDSLTCVQCHSPNGRLEKLAGFYMPGRDKFGLIDKGGFALIFLSLGVVFVHGLIRIFSSSKKD